MDWNRETSFDKSSRQALATGWTTSSLQNPQPQTELSDKQMACIQPIPSLVKVGKRFSKTLSEVGNGKRSFDPFVPVDELRSGTTSESSWKTNSPRSPIDDPLKNSPSFFGTSDSATDPAAKGWPFPSGKSEMKGGATAPIGTTPG